ncbi:MAG TPA: hypothetical protein PLG34_12055 [Spirochaetota bacterium]|jgi:DNA-dependent RNA polymerase auxiliary subunit epsilon|nr:MAG: hypothetical protein BWX91_00181 [Spirochaetes bacterium ADurb.Bin133]HNZ25813.1 hypothetical protein [Spirochaetota bacterium]HPY88702.1 hypothetical protein [Spirochaetota bacterium]
MIIDAKITGIKYTPLLCKNLKTYDINDLDLALSKDSSFILKVKKNNLPVSWWVSSKRTRSYPFARVYNTLGHVGKKITIIPFVKDEGIDGDRDFIQWDTISLMSLLDVNVIIAYYSEAEKNKKYQNKISNQKYDIEYLKKKIDEILSYKSSALHWNIEQLKNISTIAELSKKNYELISFKNSIKLHSTDEIDKRIEKINDSISIFMNESRKKAKAAQERESITIQPKEYLSNGIKAQINIKNYLGGIYYLTSDEAMLEKNKIFIIEGKHSKNNVLPSLDDIKDGLLKMILYVNLKDVEVEGKLFDPIPVLKLTSKNMYNYEILDKKKKIIIDTLQQEAKINNFVLKIE